MTNVESYLVDAVQALESDKLNSFEGRFVNSIRDYSKKELKGLSSKQFLLLREIANK